MPVFKVFTSEATASFTHLIEPRETPSGELKYQLCLIFDEGADLSDIEKAAMAAGVDRWGEKAKAMFAQKKLRWPLRDGAEKMLAGFGPGKTFLNASSNRQPGVVDRYAGPDGKPRPLDPGEIYAGCRVRASLLAFAYDVNGNRGVSFMLNNVQKLGDGPRLDGRMRAEDEFEPLEKEPANLEELDDDPMAA